MDWSSVGSDADAEAVNYRSIYIPTLNCSHERWVVTKNEIANTSG